MARKRKLSASRARRKEIAAGAPKRKPGPTAKPLEESVRRGIALIVKMPTGVYAEFLRELAQTGLTVNSYLRAAVELKIADDRARRERLAINPNSRRLSAATAEPPAP